MVIRHWVSLVLFVTGTLAMGHPAWGGVLQPSVCGALARVATPDPGPASNGEELSGVASLSAADAWAVGDYSDAVALRDQALAEHWDGQAWHVVPTPDLGGATSLADVAMVSPNDVWAVGAGPTGGLVEHWDGSSWSDVPAPTSGPLTGVAAISATDVWTVGSIYVHNSNLLVSDHWDGSTWATVTPAPTGDTYSYFDDVTALPTGKVWAAGNSGDAGFQGKTIVEHWNGTNWVLDDTPEVGLGNNILQGVTAIGPSDVWAVGYYSPEIGSTYTLAEHWDGVTWTIVATPGLPSGSGNSFTSVAGLSQGDVWAGGSFGVGARPLLEHWDGTSWEKMPTPKRPIENGLDDVWVSPGGELWGVGSEGSYAADLDALTLHLCETELLDSGFAPATTVGSQGAPVAWNVDPDDSSGHTVTDGSRMGLFDSGLVPPGSSFVFAFAAAGRYSVVDTVTSNASSVAVPTRVQPRRGGVGTTFIVTWCSRRLPAGFLFDVQIKRPGSASFVDWMTNQTATAAPFLPDAGPGTYQFHSRVRDESTGAATGYSPAASIRVG